MGQKRFEYGKEQLEWMATQLDENLPRIKVIHGFLDAFSDGKHDERSVNALREFMKRTFPDDIEPAEAIGLYFQKIRNRNKGRAGRKLFTEYTPEHIDRMAELLSQGLSKQEVTDRFVKEHVDDDPCPGRGYVLTGILPMFRKGQDPFDVARQYRENYKTRGEKRREIEAKEPPEVRNRVAIANALMTRRERSAAVKRGWANITEEEKRGRIENISTGLTQEERDERARKAWKTRWETGVGIGVRKIKRRLPGSDRFADKLPDNVGFEGNTIVELGHPDAPDMVEQNQRKKLILEALSALEGNERRVIELTLEGRTNEEISDEIGLPTREVPLAYGRAIKKLQRHPLIKGERES